VLDSSKGLLRERGRLNQPLLVRLTQSFTPEAGQSIESVSLNTKSELMPDWPSERMLSRSQGCDKTCTDREYGFLDGWPGEQFGQELQVIGNHHLGQHFHRKGSGITKDEPPRDDVFLEASYTNGVTLVKTVGEIETVHEQNVLTAWNGSVGESLILELHAEPTIVAREEEAVLVDRRPQRRVAASQLYEWIIGIPDRCEETRDDSQANVRAAGLIVIKR